VSGHAVVPRSGDLARRVASRQNALGLSTQDLAIRAGMDIGYLTYLEQSADTSASGAALLRLAEALDTTTAALVGGDVDRPPGEGRAGPHPRLETLSKEDCEAHLAAGGVGRIVFSTEKGPVAFPVNFVSQEGDVLFRTDDSVATAIEKERIVSFEVDRIDEAMSEGWSVLATGAPSRVEDTKKHRELVALDIEPWAGGARNVFIRIATAELSGRVIVQRESETS
jgi:nitroimidazol reductase NimA-like FMN-containing flavoprotein (pyridoxamine 5'-phosphate oxidase superfamily)